MVGRRTGDTGLSHWGGRVARLGVILALLALTLGYSWMFAGSDSPNERSRIYLAVSLVDSGTVSIQSAIDRYGGVFDLARVDGEPRCDKAPGASLLGAAVYGAARVVTTKDGWSLNDLMHLMRFWLMIPVGLFGFLMLRVTLFEIGLDPPAVDVTSVAYLLGTSAFHYSHAFFGHQIAGSALIGAVGCLLVAERYLDGGVEGERNWVLGARGWGRILAGTAGGLAGVAGMTEYPAAIPCVFVAVFALMALVRRDGWAFAAFVAGALPFAAILFGYHIWAFGGPLELPYFHLVQDQFEKVHESGWGGLKMPHWEWFWGGVFSLHRGLLGTSPLFLLVAPGLWAMWRSGHRRLAVLVFAVTGYYIAFISSWPLWKGGWGYGPRHLVAMMGVAMVPVGAALSACSASWLGQAISRGLIVFSILCHQVIGAFFPEVTPGAKNPVVDIAALMWSHDLVAPNLVARFSGLEGVITLWPLGVLVGGWIGWLMVRGWQVWRARGVSVVGRVAIPVVALFVTVGGIGGLTNVGGSWDEKEQKEFKGLGQYFHNQQEKVREKSRR